MIRRNFIAGLTLAGASTLGAGESKTVTYKVKGFSCITCAVGLDTMLRQQKGVVQSKFSYPDAITTIEFKPSLISEDSLRKFISEMGFTATEAK